MVGATTLASALVLIAVAVPGFASAADSTCLTAANVYNGKVGVALKKQAAVKTAKTAAKQPLDLTAKQNTGFVSKSFQWIMRLVQFNIDFVRDMVGMIGGMFGIRAAK